MLVRYLALCAALTVGACTTPADVSKPLTAGDRDQNVKATIKNTATGFSVDVKYRRYQFIPETDALLVACRSAVTARAYDEAKARGREIEPINEQTIRVSTGRNGLIGMTSCRAFLEAKWRP